MYVSYDKILNLELVILLIIYLFMIYFSILFSKNIKTSLTFLLNINNINLIFSLLNSNILNELLLSLTFSI